MGPYRALRRCTHIKHHAAVVRPKDQMHLNSTTTNRIVPKLSPVNANRPRRVSAPLSPGEVRRIVAEMLG